MGVCRSLFLRAVCGVWCVWCVVCVVCVVCVFPTATGLGTSWESALPLGFFCVFCAVLWVRVGLSFSVPCGVWCVCFQPLWETRRLIRAAGTSSVGDARRRRSRARARGESAPTRGFLCVCVCVSCVRRVASRRLFIASRVRSFVRSFVRFPFCALFHARRNEWARHRPVDHRRSRATSSFGRVKIVSRRSIVARSRARRCTSPRARIAAAVGARDRANPSVEGTSSREIRAWISSACARGWSRGRARRVGGF